ncbi:MAG: PIN domain-containing protein [Acidobacteriota bacterium]
MASNALIDTGAIVALLDPREPWHKPCVAALRHLQLPLLTSEAVLTEVFHLADKGRKEMEAGWAFIRSGAISVAAIDETEMPEVHALMSKYWDRPMDFADATLVYLASRHSLTTILTIDHSDFETYRIQGRKRFRIVPGRMQ